MSHRSTVTKVGVGVLIVTLSASTLLSRQMHISRPEARLEEVMYVSSPKAVKWMSLGYTGLAACMYWTRAVQYFGGKHVVKSQRYDLLKPLLNLTVGLDPHLIVAYEFGSIFLAQKPPQGAGDVDAAVELVERGIKENPERWRLYYHLGFIHFVEREDYTAAAEAFEKGSQIQGAQPWMKIMAAAMRQRAGDSQTARLLWTEIYKSTEDPMVKQNAVARLLALRVEDEVTQLENIVSRYISQFHSAPTNWWQVVQAGMLPGAPLDPNGRPYKLKNGRVELSDPNDFPFVRKGLPEGMQPLERILPEKQEEFTPAPQQ